MRIFLFLHWIWKNWRIRRHNISCVLADREKMFLNGKQSEVPVNHPLKGRPFKRVTYKANKTKKKQICIFPKANQQTVSPFLWKMNREICLTLKIWGLSLFRKSYTIWRPRGRTGFLSLNDGEEPDQQTNRVGTRRRGILGRFWQFLTNVKYIFGKSLVLCSWLTIYDFPNLPSNDRHRKFSPC